MTHCSCSALITPLPNYFCQLGWKDAAGGNRLFRERKRGNKEHLEMLSPGRCQAAAGGRGDWEVLAGICLQGTAMGVQRDLNEPPPETLLGLSSALLGSRKPGTVPAGDLQDVL